MNNSLFYALWLFLACLAACMLGYAFSTAFEDNKPSEGVSLPPEVRYYGTVEAQGHPLPEPHFDDYNEYEAHVAEIINDKENR